VVRQADRGITFKQLQADPDAHAGKIVILGGTLVSVLNQKKGALIEIAEKKLDYWGKPRRTEKSGGHFQVLHQGYLDAMLYAPGRDITVAGEVVGSGDRPAAGIESTFVLLRSRELKIWPREKLTWDKPQWIDPLYDRTSPQGQYGY
jgi:outer membrane lipoprotein